MKKRLHHSVHHKEDRLFNHRTKFDIEEMTGQQMAEKSVKDRVYKTFEMAIHGLPQAEARLIARQLAQAFSLAAEGIE